MSIRSKWLNGAAIGAGQRVQVMDARLATKNPPLLLRKRRDGTLAFMNGSPVRAGELVPGKEYKIIIDEGA